MTRKVVASLEGVLNGRIEISKIHLRPFNALVLKDVAVSYTHLDVYQRQARICP